MAKSRVQKTIFRRNFIQLSLAILVIFSVLAFSYLIIFRELSEAQMESQLLRTSEAVANEYEKALSYDYLELSSSEALPFANFAARSTNSLIWLINARGEVIYATAFPRFAEEEFGRDNLLPKIPTRYLNTSGHGKSHAKQFSKYLSAGESWLSVSWPLQSELGGYVGEVLIHKEVTPEELPGSYLLQSLLISGGIAVGVAFLAILLLARNLTMPISALAKTAEAVYHGDLSARVELKGLEQKFLTKRDLEEKNPHDDDLTLLVKTMNSLIASLEEEEEDRQAFLASISHDLRSPLTTIKGFVEGILDGTIPPERSADYLKLVKQETSRMEKLVQSLFDASLAERRESLDTTVFDLNELLTHNINLLENEIKAKELNLSYEFFGAKRDGSLPVIGDPQLIHRVVANLLLNAIHFTPRGGEISLKSALADRLGYVEIRLEDSGPGVAEDERDLIFDRFYKVDKSRSSQGSGLGLYISRSILARHGGTIRYFDSALGGAGFVFELAQPKGHKI